MQINTVNEQDCYDKGFADGKDYWTDAEQERIIKLLENMPTREVRTEDGREVLSLELKDIIALIKGETK